METIPLLPVVSEAIRWRETTPRPSNETDLEMLDVFNNGRFDVEDKTVGVELVDLLESEFAAAGNTSKLHLRVGFKSEGNCAADHDRVDEDKDADAVTGIQDAAGSPVLLGKLGNKFVEFV